MNLTVNFYPFLLSIIENSPLNKKSNSLLVYKSSQLLLTLTTREVKPTSCLQFSHSLSLSLNFTSKNLNILLAITLSRLCPQEVKPTSCYKSRNYYNSIINLEQIKKN